jgi:hypothetical protein
MGVKCWEFTEHGPFFLFYPPEKEGVIFASLNHSTAITQRANFPVYLKPFSFSRRILNYRRIKSIVKTLIPMGHKLTNFTA